MLCEVNTMYASFFGIKISTTAGVSDEQLYMNFMMYEILNKVLHVKRWFTMKQIQIPRVFHTLFIIHMTLDNGHLS